MQRCRAVGAIALMGLGGWSAACALGDVFRPGRLEDVVIAFRGDTIIAAGDTVPFSVDVCVRDARLPNPRLEIVVPAAFADIVLLTSGGDSLVGLRNGQAELSIRFLNSIFTDTVPTLIQKIRVSSNPPAAAPGCGTSPSP
ncbi:MAG: hypothetical protein ACREL9_07575 [Gemmatimonadales bacterium]